ncbi:MAG: lipid-A-disaccharide synthase [Candidatus Omnitrophica bacterium]|nr:lipid-A-disaccharide synthase [Candidatus Omnitrophota bacterium]
MKKIVIVAGDTSGDLYGALLCRELKQRYGPELALYSCGGEKMARESEQILDIQRHSVSGIFEVVRHLKTLAGLLKKCVQKVKTLHPDLVILIDFPDFNLRLARTLYPDIPVFYYVSPQVWAWRKKRVLQIKKYIKKMIVIFAFERDFYGTHQVDALYFGHPLLEVIQKKGFPPQDLITFLPGSRKNEIQRHLGVLREARDMLAERLPGYRFQILRPRHLDESLYRPFFPAEEISLHSYDILESSRFVVSSSGTATIEIALLEIPYCVIYKVHPLTWHLIRKLVTVDSIAMANIVASDRIIDELLQHDANPRAIADTVLEYLTNPVKYGEMKEKLKTLKRMLGPDHATSRFAEYIGNYLGLSAA